MVNIQEWQSRGSLRAPRAWQSRGSLRAPRAWQSRQYVLLIMGCLFHGLIFAATFEVTEQPFKNTLLYGGTLEPLQKQVLESPVKGILKGVSVHYGARVFKDKSLWHIESSELESRLKEAEALKLEAEQRMQGLLQWAERSEVQQARQQIHRAKTNLQRLQNRSHQTQKLFEAGIVSKDERDQDLHAVEDATEWLEDAQRSFDQIQKNYNKKSLKIVELQYENTAKQVQLLYKKRARLTPKVPFDGILLPPPPVAHQASESLLVVGTKVQEDQVLGILVPIHAYKVTVFVDEIELAQLSVGLPVAIQIQALPQTVLRGRVSELHFYPNQEVSTHTTAHYLVQITVEEISESLKKQLHYGMKVLVTLEVGDEKGVLSIPKTALTFKGEEVFVRLNKKGKWVNQLVTIGRRSTEFVEIVGGLSIGDQVVNPYQDE